MHQVRRKAAGRACGATECSRVQFLSPRGRRFVLQERIWMQQRMYVQNLLLAGLPCRRTFVMRRPSTPLDRTSLLIAAENHGQSPQRVAEVLHRCFAMPRPLPETRSRRNNSLAAGRQFALPLSSLLRSETSSCSGPAPPAHDKSAMILRLALPEAGERHKETAGTAANRSAYTVRNPR